MEETDAQSKPIARRSPFWWFRWVPTIVLAAIALYIVYEVGSVVIVPVLASVALAYLLAPIVHFFEKRGLSRAISSFIAILVVLLSMTAFVSYVIPELWSQTSAAGKKMIDSFTPENAVSQRAWVRRVSPALERVAGDKIEQFLSDPATFYSENVSQSSAATVDAEGNIRAGRSSGAAIFSVLAGSVDLLLIPFFVFYILLDFPQWRDSLEDLIPPRYRAPFSRLFDESGRILESYVRGQLLIGMIMAVLYAAGFWFMGVPAWAGIALIAGLLNAIPYIGTAIGILLATALTIASGGGAWDVAGVLGVFVAVQTIEGYILTPRILGGRLNLHPMAVFIGLLAGGKLFGLLGMILAIPAIAITKVFLRFAKELYHSSTFYHNGEVLVSSVRAESTEEKVAQAAHTVLKDQKEQGEKDKLE